MSAVRASARRQTWAPLRTRPAWGGDVFALGVILFEMLTGQRPFQGENLAALLGAILRDEPPSVRTLRPALPLALDGILT